MVLGKMWLFSIGNGTEIQPLEMGRKSPVQKLMVQYTIFKTVLLNLLKVYPSL